MKTVINIFCTIRLIFRTAIKALLCIMTLWCISQVILFVSTWYTVLECRKIMEKCDNLSICGQKHRLIPNYSGKYCSLYRKELPFSFFRGINKSLYIVTVHDGFSEICPASEITMVIRWDKDLHSKEDFIHNISEVMPRSIFQIMYP